MINLGKDSNGILGPHSLHHLMVSTLLWLPVFCGYHPPVVTTSHGLHVWFPPSHGYHLLLFACMVTSLLWLSCMVSTLPWFAPSCGLHPPVVCMCGFHPAVVCTLPWSHGYHTLWLLMWCPERERESCYKTHLTSMAAKKEVTPPASF